MTYLGEKDERVGHELVRISRNYFLIEYKTKNFQMVDIHLVSLPLLPMLLLFINHEIFNKGIIFLSSSNSCVLLYYENFSVLCTIV